jgi:eukaryotic-like serine/threonine-protein kinase
VSAKICPQCNTEYEAEQRFCPRDGSTLKSLSAGSDLVGSVIADRYHVIRKLGEGGMGQVYLAEHVRMGRKSAVKVMNPGMVHDADAISRFNREASNASRISHPNVAAIYDFGETSDGLIYLAMEFVEGEPLTKLIEREGALSAARAASIVRQTGEALAVAHDLGIVHRDLKPDNIMIAKDRDGADCVKVVDFGIAKAANNEAQKVTRTGLVVGTPEYMSPEQLAGDALDGRSDVYSLALVAFTMLTGRLPFPSETVQESMIMRLTVRPRSLSEMKPDVNWPSPLQAAIDKGLARDARERYATASEFGRDVWQAVERMPQTVATDAKTSIMAPQSVPATRVGAAPTMISSGIEVTPAKRSKVPVMAGLATVIIGAVVVFGVLTRSNHNTAAAPIDRGISASNGTRDSARAHDSALAITKRVDTASQTSALAGNVRPVAEPMSRAAIRRAIDDIKQQSDPTNDPATLNAAIRGANRLLPKLGDGGDSVEALYYRAQAQGASDQAGACDTYRSIEPRARSIRHQLAGPIKVALTACTP